MSSIDPRNVTPESIEVVPGQIWADLDKRVAGRTVLVTAVEAGKATVLDQRNQRTTKISVRRMHPSSHEYRLSTQAPGRKAPQPRTVVSKPLTGHGLSSEGGPFDEFGRSISLWRNGGTGRAKCECDALSEVLDSKTKRQEWHRQHKAAVRAEMADVTRTS